MFNLAEESRNSRIGLKLIKGGVMHVVSPRRDCCNRLDALSLSLRARVLINAMIGAKGGETGARTIATIISLIESGR